MVVVSWNLKGSENPDTGAIADHLRATGADVVCLQEVQWHQARRIARALGAQSCGWGFKHWPIRTWPEGMAVIGVTVPVRVRTRALTARWRLWSWRRRILQVATVGTLPAAGAAGGAGSGAGPAPAEPVTVVNVHLTPHGRPELRGVETTTVLALIRDNDGPVVVCGDFNERPGGPIHGQLAEAGLRDGWRDPEPGDPAPGDGRRPPDPWPTNWRGWQRGTSAAPTQRLDYVYVSTAIGAVEVTAPTGDALATFAALSDHLPITAVLEVVPSAAP